MRRLIASCWEELSNDDLARIDRRRDGLAEVLRDRYGWDARRAEAEICAFEKDVRWPGAREVTRRGSIRRAGREHSDR